VYTLAEKIAAALGSSHSFVLEVKRGIDCRGNRPRQYPQDPGRTISRCEARALSRLGDAQVQVTISQNLAGFVLVAEIRRQDGQQVAVVPVASTDELPPQPGPSREFSGKLFWQQAVPILDFVQVPADSRRTLWYFLEPDRLVAYESTTARRCFATRSLFSRRYTSRDMRGTWSAADAMHVSAFWQDALRRVLESKSFRGMPGECGPTVADGYGQLDSSPGAKLFSGQASRSQTTCRQNSAFLSSASPSPGNNGLSSSRRIVAGLDGQTELFVGSAEPASNFDGWGSDLVSHRERLRLGVAGAGDGSGDWTEKGPDSAL